MRATRRTVLYPAAALALLQLLTVPTAASRADLVLHPYYPGRPAQGIGATDDRPGYALNPADEDWSWLDDHDGPRDPYDRFKRVPLDPLGNVRLTLSALGHAEYEWFDDAVWGSNAGDDPYFNGRLNIYGEIDLYDRVRMLGAVKHGSREGSRFTVLPIERDDLDLHQAFIEASIGDAFGLKRDDVLVRLGRQELFYGDGRMITVREGPNVRRDHDGALVRVRAGSAATDLFGFFDVGDETGAFDNEKQADSGVWGIYSAIGLPTTVLSKPLSLDAYYIGDRSPGTSYATASLDEARHSLGGRFYLPPGLGWTFDVEGTAQFGSGRDATGVRYDLGAYAVRGSLGYGFDTAWSPMLTFGAGHHSGDNDPDDRTVTTFRAPYPSTKYFGAITPLGPTNLTGASLALEVSPTERLTLTGRAIGYWRTSNREAVFSASQTLIRPADGDAHYIGTDLSLETSYAIDRHWTLGIEAARFTAGSFLTDNPPAEDITRAKVALEFRF